MKKLIAFLLILLFSVSSLQLCSANEIDGRNSNNPNTNNGYPIIIQMPANTPKDSKNSKDSKFEKFKEILNIVKWPTIISGGVAFLYIKYHKPVEDFSDKMSNHVEELTNTVSSWSSWAIGFAIFVTLASSLGYCGYGAAALVKAIKG